MMKYLIYLIPFLFLFNSCSEDDDYCGCAPPPGSMILNAYFLSSNGENLVENLLENLVEKDSLSEERGVEVDAWHCNLKVYLNDEYRLEHTLSSQKMLQIQKDSIGNLFLHININLGHETFDSDLLKTKVMMKCVDIFDDELYHDIDILGKSKLYFDYTPIEASLDGKEVALDSIGTYPSAKFIVDK